MSDERYQKRAAYLVAKARHRAFAARYEPGLGLGARPALQLGDDARGELARLGRLMEAAEQEWRACIAPPAQLGAAEDERGS